MVGFPSNHLDCRLSFVASKPKRKTFEKRTYLFKLPWAGTWNHKEVSFNR